MCCCAIDTTISNSVKKNFSIHFSLSSKYEIPRCALVNCERARTGEDELIDEGRVKPREHSWTERRQEGIQRG